jgi:hypothetical protein
MALHDPRWCRSSWRWSGALRTRLIGRTWGARPVTRRALSFTSCDAIALRTRRVAAFAGRFPAGEIIAAAIEADEFNKRLDRSQSGFTSAWRAAWHGVSCRVHKRTRRFRLVAECPWVAYQSNESGRFEIYAQPFPAASAKWQISTGGGTMPRWRGDGEELFLIAPGNVHCDTSYAHPQLAAAAVSTESDTFSFDAPFAGAASGSSSSIARRS